VTSSRAQDGQGQLRLRLVGALAVAAALALVVASCGGDDESGDKAASGQKSSKPLAGQQITVVTGWAGDEGEEFEAVLKQFTDETGIKVNHRGSPEVEQELKVAVDGGRPPDLAFVPQPALNREFYAKGVVKPIDGVVDVSKLESALVPGALGAAKAEDGKVIALPFRLAVKSLVWYNPKVFADHGYQPPTTLAELNQLTDKMRSDGVTPWCITDKQGWVMTDWVEDIMLRTAGPDAYDKWITNDLKFTSPEVKTAVGDFGKIALTKGNVLGGNKSIGQLDWDGSIPPLLKGKCAMHRQAGFFRDSLPKDTKIGTDVKTFYLPPGDNGGKPVLGFGDQISLMSDKPAAKELVKWLSKPSSGEAWGKLGSFLSPYKDFDQNLYPDDETKFEAKVLSEADPFRFDASDLMPSAVGSGTFWAELEKYVDGANLDSSLAAIDKSWPQ
jgi:alpha-glucoside transport system substrate-binding protein